MFSLCTQEFVWQKYETISIFQIKNNVKHSTNSVMGIALSCRFSNLRMPGATISAQSADQFHQRLLSLPSDLPNLFDWSDRVIRVESANFEHKVQLGFYQALYQRQTFVKGKLTDWLYLHRKG